VFPAFKEYMDIINNHFILPVISEQGKELRLLVDTGSPVTFLRRGLNDSFTVGAFSTSEASQADEPLKRMARQQVNFRDVENNLTGSHVDGVLGADFFQTQTVLFDTVDSRLEMGVDIPAWAKTAISISQTRVPMFNIEVGGHQLQAGWDTGAMHTVVPMGFPGTLSGETLEETDFNPFLGSFDITRRKGMIRSGPFDLGVCPVVYAPAYDLALNMFGFDAILGTSALLGRQVFISYARKLLGIR